MTYACKNTGLTLFKEVPKLNFRSAIAMTKCANSMVMLEIEKRMKAATRLHERSAERLI